MADNVQNIGKIFVVDPNPPNNETIPLEDLFIYVKFTAYPRSRTTYNGTDLSGNDFINFGVEDEVNFISTKIRYNEDGKLDPPTQQTYATTDWTNISTFGDSTSGGILEGFGIKSISIKYNASLVPQVDITFTDVRGSALFDKISDNSDIKSPYSVFFKLPYPIFRLSIKGYYGQKVDYCLHMVNWTSSFDNNTGNFDISANFLSYQQAILNDMVLGNIIGVLQTEEGYQELQEITKDSQPIRIDDFLVKLSKLQIESEIIKSQSKSFDILKKLNGKLSLLKQIQGFIGKPIKKDSDSNTPSDIPFVGEINPPFLKTPNDKIEIKTDGFTQSGTNLVIDRNYLSVRDFLLIKTTNTNDFKNFVINLNDAIKKYNQYIVTINNSRNVKNSVSSQEENSKSNNNDLKSGDKDNKLLLSFKDYFGANSENNWVNFIFIPTRGDNNLPEDYELQSILSVFGTRKEDSQFSLQRNPLIIGEYVNQNFSIDNFNVALSNGEFYDNTNFLPNSRIIVADFRVQRALLQDLIIDVEKDIKELRDKVEEEINQKLIENFQEEFKTITDFKPNIKNCFKILMDNTQAMIQTIYNISSLSEEKSLVSERNKILNKTTYETDIPSSFFKGSGQSIKGVSFPSVYTKSVGDEPGKEIYLGSIPNINEEYFPEVKFVNKVFDKIVNRREFLKQVTKASQTKGLDSDNWFPINPMDYSENPFFIFNGLNDQESINRELFKTILTRLVLLKNYSNFSKPYINEVSTFAKFDRLNAENSILTNNPKLLIKNTLTAYKNSNNINQFLIDIGLGDIFTKTNDSIVIGDNKLSVSGIDLTSDFLDIKATYIEFDNNNVINNSKKLLKTIVGTEAYGKITEGNNKITFYENNNITTNCLTTVFLNQINSQIKSNNSLEENLENITYDIINPNDEYINKTRFKIDSKDSCKYEQNLVGNTFYNKQSNIYSRAYLALSTLPFNYFNDGFIKILFDLLKYNNARIVKLPELYVYYIGSLLWRLGNNFGDIDFNISISGNCSYNIFSSPNSKYLTKLGSKQEDREIEPELQGLPISVKEIFIDQFIRWTDLNFNSTRTGKFEKILEQITNENDIFSTDVVNVAKKQIADLFKIEKNLIIYNINIFNPIKQVDENFGVNNELRVLDTDLDTYVNNFLNNFETGESTQNSNVSSNEDSKKDKEIKDGLKLQLYNYFKNINDKWISDTKKGFNICGGKNKNLIDYFKFIDRGWNNIGDKAVFDLKSFINLGTDLDVSIYLFISKILRDSNFLFQILPNYINYRKTDEVSQIFRPQTTLEDNIASGPIFCCIYAGGNSQVLDIGERNNYYFKNDGISFVNGVIPKDLEKNNVSEIDENFSLVAFRVAFGSQNQSIFKSVSLNQQEHKETAEYFKVLSDTIDKRGATQRSYQGTNLLKLFKTRSYQCTVESMGCMNIQPLMYFDLQNVPFFNGAYLITNVTHQISPNNMSTTFNGLRQSKFVTPVIEEITTSLDVNLDESFDVPKIEFTNLSPNNSLYSISVKNPEQLFDFGNFDVVNFRNIGVTNFTDAELGTLLNSFEQIIKDGLGGIDNCTNAQVCMFIANVLTQSQFLNQKELEWGIDEQVIEYFNNKPIYYDVIESTNNVKPVLKDSDIDDKYLTVQPIYTATTLGSSVNIPIVGAISNVDNSNQLSYIPRAVNTKLKTEKKYYNIFDGDPYRYKPRGYLYVIGRSQYYDFFEPLPLLRQPNTVSLNETQAMVAATKVWTKLKDENNKSCFDYIKGAKEKSGRATVFERTVVISQQLNESKKIENSFIIFEKVLQNFTFINDVGVNEPLINYFG